MTQKTRDKVRWLLESTPVLWAIVSSIVGFIFLLGTMWADIKVLIEDANVNTVYRIIEVDAVIQKQREKLLSNPKDLKVSDLKKLIRFKKEGILLPTQVDLVDEIMEDPRTIKALDEGRGVSYDWQ